MEAQGLSEARLNGRRTKGLGLGDFGEGCENYQYDLMFTTEEVLNLILRGFGRRGVIPDHGFDGRKK